ncbi:dual specificity testis-specific protein kinase 2 isoform X2 [Cimex lectularius]|uniref:dual-specificity kinase n=1 Tax=Cimex lectularius TaxID=79782 RepID=A0A8I6TJT6_CIMLE|nr:dual specificity testis-specific protein kinase 2 isoform X2 [Cimex lectularius]
MSDEERRDSRVTGSSCLALKSAVATLNRLDDFFCEKIGTGFFSEVFKVTHKVTGEVMVLKMNLLRSNRPNMLKEVQLMNQLSHPNILGFMGVCVHEGQLHALTEYINGGRLEQIIQNRSIPLPFSVRMKLALDIGKGMEYLHCKDIFHRDLTSKNVLVKTNNETGEMTAVVGDFGFAAKIPKCGYRLTTVGSAYWMSPECLKGEWYDQSSDVFSYGIILCELIARVEADPDILTRTENFGLDYIAFAKLCQAEQPPSAFLKLAFTCCNYEPRQRPSFAEIVPQLENIMWNAKGPHKSEADASCSTQFSKDASPHTKLGHRRSLSDDVIRVLGETMAQQDVHYKPAAQNPFANIPAFKGGKKIVNSSTEATTSESDASVESSTVVAEPVVKPSKVLESIRQREKMDQASLLDAIFSGRCFSLGSPSERDRRKTDEDESGGVGGSGCSKGGGCDGRRRTLPVVMPPSLPSSPTFSRRADSKDKPQSSLLQSYRTFSSGSNLAFLDDHAIPTVLHRRGSCESGFFSSVGEDFCHPSNDLIASSVTLSSSSAASSLLLDSGSCEGFCLRYCHHIRNALNGSSDSTEDVSITSDHIVDEKVGKCAFSQSQHQQQIQKMVEYFERKGEHRDYYRHLRHECRPRRPTQMHRLIVCEGAVRSKLQIFDKK